MSDMDEIELRRPIQHERNPEQANPEYRVGYRRPPQHSRFQPGQSGNPRGRQKSLDGIDIKQDLRDVFLKELPVVDNGERRRMPTIVFLYEQLVRAGAKGNIRATIEAVKLARELGALNYQQKVGLDLSTLPPEDYLKCTEALAILRKHRIFKG